MPTRADLYDGHLADTKRRLDALLEAVSPGLPITLRRSPIVDGFRGLARFSVDATEGTVAVTGVDPLRGPADWKSTLWTLPGFGRRLAVTLIGRIIQDHSCYPVRGFDLRLGHGTERAHVVLAVDRAEPASFGGWAEALLRETPGVSGVSVPSQRVRVGDPLIRHTLLDREILSHPQAFFQTNYWLTEDLLRHVASAVTRERPRSVLDLYCGVGVHSLLAGHHDPPTTGVDTDRLAIAVARQNAEQAGRCATFERMSVETFLTSGFHPHLDVTIVNPPRTGCHTGVVEAIAERSPGCVCLVCCSADSQVRDLARFRAVGYEAREYTAFDMFPFTRFVENVTTLSPR